MLTIFLYLPSCVHSSPKRGRFRSGLWRGGEAAPAPVEYRSAVPGGLLKAAWRSGLPSAAQKAKSPLRGAKGQIAFARSCELARPGLRRGRVRERLKARRRRAFPHGPAEGDGERRSGGEILSALREVGFRPRRQTGATLRAGLDGTPAPGTKDTPPERDGATCVPAKGGATFPRGIGGVTAPMPVGPFAPESKTGVPKIAERGAPGRHPSLIKASTARRSAPPVFICRTPRAKAAGTRELVASIQPMIREHASVLPDHALIVRSHAASHGVSNDEGSREVRNRGRRGLVLRDAGPSGPAPQDEAMEWPIRQATPSPSSRPERSAEPGPRLGGRERLDPGSGPGMTERGRERREIVRGVRGNGKRAGGAPMHGGKRDPGIHPLSVIPAGAQRRAGI